MSLATIMSRASLVSRRRRYRSRSISRAGCRSSRSSASRRPPYARARTACAARSSTPSSNFRSAASPSISRRPSSPRTGVGSISRSRPGSSPRPGSSATIGSASTSSSARLALDGALRRTGGSLPAALHVRDAGRILVIPVDDAHEAELADRRTSVLGAPSRGGTRAAHRRDLAAADRGRTADRRPRGRKT